MAAEKYCDRIYNCRKSDVRNSNDDNTNNNEAKDRNSYKFCRNIFLQPSNPSTESHKYLKPKNENKNGNKSGNNEFTTVERVM